MNSVTYVRAFLLLPCPIDLVLALLTPVLEVLWLRRSTALKAEQTLWKRSVQSLCEAPEKLGSISVIHERVGTTYVPSSQTLVISNRLTPLESPEPLPFPLPVHGSPIIYYLTCPSFC